MAILYVQKVFHFQNFLAYCSCNRKYKHPAKLEGKKGERKMITRKIKIETISKVKDFVNEISKVDVNADLSNPDRRYIVDAKSILGILSLDISHVMNLTIYDEEKNAGKYEKIFEEFGVRDNN